jgi:hypothetical protein
VIYPSLRRTAVAVLGNHLGESTWIAAAVEVAAEVKWVSNKWTWTRRV